MDCIPAVGPSVHEDAEATPFRSVATESRPSVPRPDATAKCTHTFWTARPWSSRSVTSGATVVCRPTTPLSAVDVVVWWGHTAHDEVADDRAAAVRDRVLAGTGLVVLHSAHLSKPFRLLMGTSLANVITGGIVGPLTERHGYGPVFLGIAGVLGASGVLLLGLTPVLKRNMHGIK